jgi:hypothetical protein
VSNGPFWALISLSLGALTVWFLCVWLDSRGRGARAGLNASVQSWESAHPVFACALEVVMLGVFPLIYLLRGDTYLAVLWTLLPLLNVAGMIRRIRRRRRLDRRAADAQTSH